MLHNVHKLVANFVSLVHLVYSTGVFNAFSLPAFEARSMTGLKVTQNNKVSGCRIKTNH